MNQNPEQLARDKIDTELIQCGWVLQNKNVSAAIIGATKPSQVKENVKAAGVALSPETMKKIDKVLGKLPETDPSLMVSPNPRP